MTNLVASQVPEAVIAFRESGRLWGRRSQCAISVGLSFDTDDSAFTIAVEPDDRYGWRHPVPEAGVILPTVVSMAAFPVLPVFSAEMVPIAMKMMPVAAEMVPVTAEMVPVSLKVVTVVIAEKSRVPILAHSFHNHLPGVAMTAFKYYKIPADFPVTMGEHPVGRR